MANWNGITREINMIIEKMRSEARQDSSMEPRRRDIHVLFQTPLRLESLDFKKNKSNRICSVDMTDEDGNNIMNMDMSGGVLTIKVYEDTRTISDRREARRESRRIAKDLVTFVLGFRSVFVERFAISMDFPDSEVRSYGKIKCDTMYAAGGDNIGKWLDHVDVRHIFVYNHACIDDRHSMEMVMKCSVVDMEDIRSGITDALLMTFEGRWLELGPSQVTANGINRFMKNMFRRRFTERFPDGDVWFSFPVGDFRVMDLLEGMRCRTEHEEDGNIACIPRIAPHWTITRSYDLKMITFKLHDDDIYWE